MIQVCRTGRNPTMRHLGRTHRVDVHWLHERFSDPAFVLYKEDTKGMRADVFTKGFTDADKWGYALYLINHIDPARFWRKNPDIPTVSGPAGGDSDSTPALPSAEEFDDSVAIDSWVYDERSRQWLCYHLRPRTSLVSPLEVPGGPDCSRLSSRRVTAVIRDWGNPISRGRLAQGGAFRRYAAVVRLDHL